MKKILCLILCAMLLLTACGMEEVIPKETDTFSSFLASNTLYQECVDEIVSLGYDCLISRTEYYAPQGSESYAGYYVQNMSDNTFSSLELPSVKLLFESSDVKMIDLVTKDDLVICSFDMCTPGRSFDYGIYYVSADQQIYLGDPSADLFQNGNGFNYEEKASYGVKFSYYTEKITDHFYYYEIM